MASGRTPEESQKCVAVMSAMTTATPGRGEQASADDIGVGEVNFRRELDDSGSASGLTVLTVLM